MSENLQCWQCGESLSNVILPMSRREECAGCGADQHVCKMCVFFDSKSRGSCKEERAESVTNTERANFCDYFKPSNAVFSAMSRKKTNEAKANFAALFGDLADPADKGELPREQGIESKELSPAQIAEQKLRDLLGG